MKINFLTDLKKRDHLILFAIINTILFFILFYGGIRHDYRAYSITWQGIINKDLTIYYHSYGPLHLLFAYIYKINFLLPKIIYGFSFFLLQSYLFIKIYKKDHTKLLYLYLALPCNFLIISCVYFYGINDAIVAFFLFFSLINKLNKNYIIAGLLFSISILIKLYPAILIPFFLIENNKINFKLFFSLLISLLILFIPCFILFDLKLIIDPLSFGVAREPKLLSILASLNNDFKDFLIINFLIKYNSLIVIFSTLIVTIYCYLKNKELLVSKILVYLVMLITYKVGHPQFYIPLFVLFGILLTESKYYKIFKSVLPVIYLLSITMLTYSLTAGFDVMGQSEYNFEIIREKIGYVFFLVNIFVFYKIIKI